MGRGWAAKVLHERVLDLTAAVVFPGSRSSYPLISNRTKNVSLAPTTVMMIIIAADEEYDDNWMADNDNDDDNYKANSRHRVVKVNGTRHQPPAIGSSLYTILYSSLICYKGYIGLLVVALYREISFLLDSTSCTLCTVRFCIIHYRHSGSNLLDYAGRKKGNNTKTHKMQGEKACQIEEKWRK